MTHIIVVLYMGICVCFTSVFVVASGGVLSDAQRLNSAKFCGLMANAIRSEIELSRLASSSSLSIVEVALVGHGSIELRVADYLDSQLLPYESNLQNADLVVVAAHSQVGRSLTTTLLGRHVKNSISNIIAGLCSGGVVAGDTTKVSSFESTTSANMCHGNEW